MRVVKLTDRGNVWVPVVPLRNHDVLSVARYGPPLWHPRVREHKLAHATEIANAGKLDEGKRHLHVARRAVTVVGRVGGRSGDSSEGRSLHQRPVLVVGCKKVRIRRRKRKTSAEAEKCGEASER